MDKLVQDAQALFNVHLTGRQIIALTTYEHELIEWNQKFNLTAIRDALMSGISRPASLT